MVENCSLGDCGECARCIEADARRDAAEVFRDHEGDLRFKLAEVLTVHWLTDLGCSHEGQGSNAASCWCGWVGPRVANVGQAITCWVSHTLEQMQPHLAAWNTREALSAVPLPQSEGVPPSGSGHSAEPGPISVVPAETASVPNALRDPLPMDAYLALPEREQQLQAIGDVIGYWLKWVTREREEEGLATEADTHIILDGDGAPPHWPSVGQLGRWLQVLRASAAVPQEDQVERLREALEEARDALEPFALLADGANMNDPLSKWFTIAHLKNAETALAASIAALAASPLSVEMGEVERVARALCADLGRQDYGEEWQLDDSLKIAYLDQGEVDFGQLARAAIAALRSSGIDGGE